MAIILQRSGKIATGQAASNTSYYLAGSGPSLTASATESTRQVTVRTAGTTSKLAIMVVSNDRGASTLRLRKNTANGNQSASITASTTGTFEDASNTDALVATDVFNYQLVTGAGGSVFNFNAISHLFDSGTNTSQRMVVHVNGAIGNNEDFPVSGQQSGSAIAGNQVKIYGNGGTFKNLAVLVATNTRDADCTATLQKGAVNQTLTVTIPTTTTGLFEDTTHTDAAVNGDLFSIRTVRPGTTGAVTVQYMALDFETTDRTFLLPSFGTTTPVAAATVFYGISFSNTVSAAAEADAQSQARMSYTLTNLRVFVATNTITANSTFNLRKNGADGNLTVSITASTGGAFEDVTHSDSAIATDLLNYQFVAGATGTSLIIRSSQLTANGATLGGSTLLMMGVG